MILFKEFDTVIAKSDINVNDSVISAGSLGLVIKYSIEDDKYVVDFTKDDDIYTDNSSSIKLADVPAYMIELHTEI